MQVAQELTGTSLAPILGAAARDGVPRNRDRVVELLMGVCIIGVLHALFAQNNYALPGKARMTEAFWGKSADEKALLETLAVDGRWGDADHGEIVSLVNMRNGTVAGLKFFTAEDGLYVVNWQCKQATAGEIAKALKALPEKAAKTFKGLEPVELPAEFGFKVCQRGGAGAQ